MGEKLFGIIGGRRLSTELWEENMIFTSTRVIVIIRTSPPTHPRPHPAGSAPTSISPLDSCIEHNDEISSLFSQANQTIQELEKQGSRKAAILKADYVRAEKAWAEYNYERTNLYLQKIVPEPILPILSILGLILLPTPLRRRHQA